MIDQILTLPGIVVKPPYAGQAISQLRQEYADIQRLYQSQPGPIQRFLESQAAGIADSIPAFVVRAAHEQQVKVAQDTRLSPATRRHLLTLLYLLGVAFSSPN